MFLEGIHHVSINVTDVAAAQKFYVDVLEMELLDRPDFGFAGVWLRAGDQEVHLMEMDSGPPLKEQHFAFKVSDIEALRQRLGDAGYDCSQPREIAGICRQSFTRDPSGNLVEFNQRL